MILTDETGKPRRYITTRKYRALLKEGKAPPVMSRRNKIAADILLAQKAIWKLDPEQGAVAAAAAKAQRVRGW